MASLAPQRRLACVLVAGLLLLAILCADTTAAASVHGADRESLKQELREELMAELRDLVRSPTEAEPAKLTSPG